jgi:hypothetical protein
MSEIPLGVLCLDEKAVSVKQPMARQLELNQISKKLLTSALKLHKL